MKFFHYKNDLSFDVSLTSVTTGERMDASMIKLVKVWTRKNGRCYVACFGNETLINNGETVTVVLNNHGLEPGPLSYTVIIDIPDQVYPDRMKHIEQTYVSEIELVKGNGETEEADVLAFFGTTIDEKFLEINDTVDELNADNQVVKATIVSILEKDAALDASINNIEDIISGIHGDESAAISRLNSSVNNLETDVNNLNTSLGAVNTLVERMDSDLSDLSADLTNNYYTKTDADNKFLVKGDYALKSDLDNINLTEYVKNSSLSANYPTNSSLSSNYATKSDIRELVDIEDVSFWITELGYVTNNDVSAYVTDTYVNENYVSWENLDEAVFNMIDNNYDVLWKVNEVVQDSSFISDISTNVSDVSVKVIDVSLKVSDIGTKLDRDYLSASMIERDYITNASVAANYTTKDEFNEVWTTGFLTQDSADELYAKTTDISTFITENDASVYLTDSDFALHSWGAISLKNTEVVNKHSLGADVSNYMFAPLSFRTLSDYLGENYAKKNDISTFKSIVFITENDYDTLVQNDEVDENTVYMINGQPVTYLTANDVSIYATKEEVSNDISTFITSNDVSIYATTSYVDTQIGNIQNILLTI